MKKLLLITLVFAGFAGCSKKGPDPTPAPTPQLAGTWKGTSLQSVEKTPTGQVLDDTTVSLAAGSEVITITDAYVRVHSGGSQGVPRYYTCKGNVLSFASDDQTIQELTDTKLRLMTVSTVVSPPNIVTFTTTYRRQ
jgi:hypothetical protein